MERAEWLLLMNIKCKLLAMEGDFTRAISQALFPGFVRKLLHFIPKGKAGRSAITAVFRQACPCVSLYSH
jgi:hypothetical protein